MSDFKPIAAQPEVNSEDMKANLQLAQVSTDGEFLRIIQKQVAWQLQKAQTPARIDTDEQESQVVEVFADMKKELKNLENLRLSKVAFPTRVVRMINELFRNIKQNIERDKLFLGGLISTRQTGKNEAYLIQQQEQQKALDENAPPIEVPVDTGIGKVQFNPPELIAPENSVTSVKGAKVTMRSDLEVTVVDLTSFLKILVSKGERNVWLGKERESLITVNLGVLKKLLKENPTKRKVGGLKIEKVSKAV